MKNNSNDSNNNSNSTKINYISAADKLYKVTKISFFYFTVSATETDLTPDDVPANEIFDISFFKDFHVTLKNRNGKVIDYSELVKRRKSG